MPAPLPRLHDVAGGFCWWMMMAEKTKIIVVQESPRDSLIRDAGSVAASWAMILPGW
jgi:hypothetical protein